MPIYEYESLDPSQACRTCSEPFEVLSRNGASSLSVCPECGAPVRRIVSRAHAVNVESGSRDGTAENSIKNYEKQGMWSHAAELAEKRSVITKDPALFNRALDNYKKGGYDAATIEKHAVKQQEKV